jgi:hypothetical protein
LHPHQTGPFNCGDVITTVVGHEDQKYIGDIPFSNSGYSWSATVSTANGASWLFISPGAGSLSAQGSSPLVITKAEDLGAGDYKGDIIFTIGTNANTFDCDIILHVESAASLVSTPEPTQAPTPEPTQAPTPEPTQAPTPQS